MNAQQLVLVERPTASVPLREALDGLAASWTLRLGVVVVVTGGPWAGWVIGPVKDA